MLKYGSNDIGRMFFGSNEIGKAYYGSDLVFQKGSSPAPPGPTTNVAYIRGGGLDGSYIDTGITPDNTTKIIIWARNWNPTSGFLFGSYSSGSSNLFAAYCDIGVNSGRITVNYAQNNSTRGGDFTNLSGYHKYELYQGEFKVDDVTVATVADSTFSNNYTIHIIGTNSAGSHVNSADPTPVDICAAQIWKNGTLLRDFAAANISGSIGLFDSVSGELFTNRGSGSFTFGTFNPNAYTPLEYVSCTGQQYIDTGVYGKKSIRVVTKFTIEGTTVTYPVVFGTMTSNTAGTYFMLQLANTSYPNRYAYFYIDGTTSNQLYNNSSSRLTGRTLVFEKNLTQARLAENFASIGSTVTFSASSSFVTPNTIILGTTGLSGSPSLPNGMNGKIYYAGFGAEANFVPASVGGVAGFYDTYNDVFKPSESGTPFVAPSNN